MDREGAPRTALELPRSAGAPPSLGFAAGIAVGVTIATIAAQVWMALHLEPLGDAMRAFGGSLRSLSALALTDAWRWGVPTTTVALLGAMLGGGVRRPWLYALVAALAIAALAATYLWATAPLTELAGNIR